MSARVTTADRLTLPPPEEELRIAEHGAMAELLACGGGWKHMLGRVVIGVGLAALFGLALGARWGGSALLWHALAVPAAPSLILLFGVPALYIVLTACDAPLSALDLAHCAARGVAALGMVLAGLAPLTLLYVVSGGGSASGTLVAFLGLIFAGMVAIAQFHGALHRKLADALPERRAAALVAATVFCVFATVAAARVWFALLGGVR